MTKDDDPFLTTKQVGDFFSVKPDTVAQWIKDGKIKGVKLMGAPGKGHRWRIRKSERDRYAQELYGSNA